MAKILLISPRDERLLYRELTGLGYSITQVNSVDQASQEERPDIIILDDYHKIAHVDSWLTLWQMLAPKFPRIRIILKSATNKDKQNAWKQGMGFYCTGDKFARLIELIRSYISFEQSNS